jgi:tRNA modification GTPase
MSASDTIVAAATPTGRGGVAVVRISGAAVPDIAAAMLGKLPAARYATYSAWRDAAGQQIDAGIALYFPAPHSFTGEHVLELQGHGGPVVVAALIERLVQLGARHARPGEFSERAFHNNKIDLAQAEAIADLIDAGSRRAAQAAMRSLQGEFSAQVNAARAALTSLRIYIEAAIDFPEEEIDFLASAELRERLADVQQRMQNILRSAEQGAVLTQGITVAIAGRPNAGKSTLMNRLAGHDVAIVTAIPGTTRDLLTQRIEIDGFPVELIDTAGLRQQTSDAIEAEGMRRARAALQRVDHILFVVDASIDPEAHSYIEEQPLMPGGVPVTVVMNKSDLLGAGNRVLPQQASSIAISAATGAGLAALRSQLTAQVPQVEAGSSSYSARARHLEALRRAAQHLHIAAQQLGSKQGELAAFELRATQQALGEVIGDVTSDELLGHIFSSFCIGK